MDEWNIIIPYSDSLAPLISTLHRRNVPACMLVRNPSSYIAMSPPSSDMEAADLRHQSQCCDTAPLLAQTETGCDDTTRTRSASGFQVPSWTRKAQSKLATATKSSLSSLRLLPPTHWDVDRTLLRWSAQSQSGDHDEITAQLVGPDTFLFTGALPA